ncbi:NUDIX hydrolase [Weissella hellenica]|uniref:ADP-ribose pyrophosphatase n=1 Tax=Weissella hellenica TaxID=46256 RepID=A0A4Y4G2S9_WEIHE|nr:NUDIX hydrolase [Weissella hellenica]NKY67091.1 NUDIX hydrolase [Weissella hellenica]GED36107.1 ADP-ribose pyrophosphatase [Weissella hellenica]SCB95193.1 ADP-ribose pyrophosphatase [Weissella hellenica]
MVNLSKEVTKFAEKVLDETTKYDGHIIRAVEQTVLLPDGRQTKRDVVYHADAIAILALTKDNKMILEKQWRAPVKQVTLEIPAGKIDKRDQNPLDAVNRELNEETRLAAKKVAPITGFYTSIGFADEYMTLYLATDLSPVVAELPQDDDEQIDLIYVDYEQATELFNSGQLKDAKTNMAYLYWRTLQ